MKKIIFFICMISLIAHADPFENIAASPEAKKKLQDMQSKSTELEGRLINLEAIIKNGSLSDMLNQIEFLKQDVSKLRGDMETFRHLTETIEQRQKDLYQELDTRLRKIEEKSSVSNSVSVSKEMDTSPSSATQGPSDQDMLDEANQFLDALKYKEAFQAYTNLIKQFPNSTSLPDAKYGLANTQFNLKNYKAAIGTYQKLLDQHPDYAKNPEALLGLANAQIQLALISDAKKTLKDLIKKYPKSDAIQNAQKRLKVLESIKP